MKGVISTAHYDGGRNFVAMIRGRKRYILLPPEVCSRLNLFPRDHPSARHSQTSWVDIDALKDEPMFNASATEVVLATGEVLYIPSHWFHYIASQDASIQCNARSGDSEIGRAELQKCGFYPPGPAMKDEETLTTFGHGEDLSTTKKKVKASSMHRHHDHNGHRKDKDRKKHMRKRKSED